MNRASTGYASTVRAQQNRSGIRGRLRGVVLVLLTLLISSCVLSAPSADAWRSDAADALDAVASELATVELALGAQQRGELFEATVQVLLVQAEEAAGTAAADFSALQPPRGHEAEHEQLSATLDDGVKLLTQARIALAAGQTEQLDSLAADLAGERAAFTELAEQLR